MSIDPELEKLFDVQCDGASHRWFGGLLHVIEESYHGIREHTSNNTPMLLLRKQMYTFTTQYLLNQASFMGQGALDGLEFMMEWHDCKRQLEGGNIYIRPIIKLYTRSQGERGFYT